MEIWPKALALLLTPPGVIVGAAFLGFLIQIWWRGFGNIIVGLCIAALLVLSLPLTGKQLLASVEASVQPLPPLSAEEAKQQAGAIIVLGGGRYADAPEYGVDTVNKSALERLRYAARLHRATGLPLLVSGGALFGEKTPEAVLMQAVLEEDFQIKPKWVEKKSHTTFENAKYSKKILGDAGINRIYLVTHAWHMRRTMWAFESMGFKVTAAPMGFATLTKEERGILGYLPSAKGLALSSAALHERLGLLWYKLRHASAEASQENVPAVTR